MDRIGQGHPSLTAGAPLAARATQTGPGVPQVGIPPRPMMTPRTIVESISRRKLG